MQVSTEEIVAVVPAQEGSIRAIQGPTAGMTARTRPLLTTAQRAHHLALSLS